jgi:hypothetical protein
MKFRIFVMMLSAALLSLAPAYAVCPPPYGNTLHADGEDEGPYSCTTAEANAQADCMAELTDMAVSSGDACEGYCTYSEGYDDCDEIFDVTASNLCERLDCDQTFIPVYAAATANGSFTFTCSCVPSIIIPPHG